MNWIPFGIAILLIICVCTVVIYVNGNRNGQKSGLVSLTSSTVQQVTFEQLSESFAIKDEDLVEITNKDIVARIVDAVPSIGQIISNSNAVKTVNEVSDNLYRVILPKGEHLVKSKEMKNAYRGYSRNKKGISAQANLVKDDSVSRASSVNITNAVMNAASIVVGQYYMSQINSRLEGLNQSIQQIADFQDNEYKSKVMALTAEIQTVSSFKLETMDNYDRTNAEMVKLDQFEHQCLELLGQANLELKGFAQKESDDYDGYEKCTKKADKWFRYQQILIRVLGEICDLRYSLSLGDMSEEKCYSNYKLYSQQCNAVSLELQEWHSKNVEQLQIELDDERRKRQGINAILFKPLALFDEKHYYKSISSSVVKMIRRQSDDINPSTGSVNLFNKDVNLILKEGKVYYLPNQNSIEKKNL